MIWGGVSFLATLFCFSPDPACSIRVVAYFIVSSSMFFLRVVLIRKEPTEINEVGLPALT